MKYKEALKMSMENLAKDEKVFFLGYNVARGSRAYGTLSDISEERCIETPVAENLMAGLAMGLSLEGFHPVLYFERHDFILNALDALVNHLDKTCDLSHMEFNMPVIVRAAVGGTFPIYPGLQHTQDFTKTLKEIMKCTEVHDLKTPGEILSAYENFKKFDKQVILIEHKDLYETEE